MNWDDEPASEQQIGMLRNFGHAEGRRLTRMEAARLIRDYRRNPAPAVSVGAAVEAPTRTTAPAGPPPNVSGLFDQLSESTRMKAYGLRTAAQQAKQALTANPDAPNVRADAAASCSMRQQFWLDTCREVRDMQIGSMHVFEFYQRYGCRFFAPTKEQVQEVLDALDGALPVWDRDHPELFYQTLELNFPQLLRRPM